MIRKISVLIMSLMLVSTFSYAQKGIFGKKEDKTEKAKESDYDKLFKDKHDTYEGLITLHKLKGKLYFEFPLELLEKEMLLGSTIKEISDNLAGISGSKSDYPMHILFTKDDKNVQLRRVNSENETRGLDPNIVRALQINSINPIVRNFKIEAWNADSTAVVFDVTEFFVGDVKELSPFSLYSMYSGLNRSEQFKKDLSSLGDVKSFSDNIVINSTLSYTYSLRSQRGTYASNKPLTATMTRSIVLLPDEPYKARITDSRMSVFFLPKMIYSEKEQRVRNTFYGSRWRLEPSDMEAYKRGETVEPKQKIVFYIDNDFPDKWKPYIYTAVNQWQEPFEKIGFKNAIEARPYPKDDPEFDPDNIKYSCIRYSPTPTQNAMGPSWVDPRSGEIINASVYVYHDIIKLLNNWMFVQTAQADQRVRTVTIPDDLIGDGLRYVIAHEVGHCLGFMHNFGASAVMPVDSLRSPTFTQKYGTTYSIMDYARFNYVAQPGDLERGVRLSPPDFGLYDYWTVKWNYTPVPEATTPEEEYEITSKWISEAIADPIYRYGQEWNLGFDPRSQNEDLGDDAIKASEYGVKNLKYIMANLDQWVNAEDKDYSYRSQLYNEIINQYRRYINHVERNIGGTNFYEKHVGDPVDLWVPLPKEKQKRAVHFLIQQHKDLDWVENKDLLANLPTKGDAKKVLGNSIAPKIFLAPMKMRMADTVNPNDKDYSAEECLQDVFNFVFGTTNKSLTDYEMNVQKDYVRLVAYFADLKYLNQPGLDRHHAAGITLEEISEQLFQVENPLIEEHSCAVCSRGITQENPYIKTGILEGKQSTDFYARDYVSAAIYFRHYLYYNEMLKIRDLLSSRVRNTTGTTKMHYDQLLANINKALEK